MEISAEQLLTQGLTLDFPRADGSPRRLTVGPSGGLSGRYTSDDQAIALRGGVAPLLRVTSLNWPVGSVRVESETTVELERARFDLTFPRGDDPTHGTIRIGKLTVPRLLVRLPGNERPLEIAQLEIHDAELVLSEDPVRFRARSLSAAQITMAVGGVSGEAVRLELKAKDFSVPDGIAVEGGEVSLPSVAIASVNADAPSLTALIGGGKGADVRDDAPELHDGQKPPRDWSALDKLKGQIDVDLTADATVPLLGRRKATHRFRIPVANGTINFKELEHCLAPLEDAVLDFAVRNDKLVFERDLPLVPFEGKTLVYWDLPPQELLLARRKRVRIGRLLQWKLPVDRAPRDGRREAKKTSSKKSVELRSLHFDDLRVRLDLAGGAVLPLAGGSVAMGTATHPGFTSLELDGALRHDVAGVIQPTELSLGLSALKLALTAIRLGAKQLSVDAVELDRLTRANLSLEGFRPGELSLSLAGLRVRGLGLSRSR